MSTVTASLMATAAPSRAFALGETIGFCEVCGREGHLVATPSQLCDHKFEICETCDEQHAETWKAIGWYLRSSPWDKLDKDIKATIRFWHVEGYVTYKTYFKALMHQQVIPVEVEPQPEFVLENPEPVDMVGLFELIELIKEVNPPLVYVIPPRVKPKGMIELFQDFLEEAA